jgi:protein-S-isoprenylcysteine O-methyltransferase Ste14
MALTDELNTAGTWLFRRRSYLPLPLFPILVLGLRGFAYPDGSHALDVRWEMLCLGVGLLGLTIRCAAVGFVPHGTSGRNTTEGQVASSLNTSGLYSLVRHPLYLGNFFLWLGPSLFPRKWWIPVIVSLTFALLYERIMFAEEAFLRRSFGQQFERWAGRTPLFWPFADGWRNRWVPPSVPFSFRTVLRREYSAFFGLIATFTALEIASDYFASGRLYLDTVWLRISLGAGAAYLILRFLKRHTRILHVPGR